MPSLGVRLVTITFRSAQPRLTSSSTTKILQIFDLTKLLTINPASPKVFSTSDATLFKGLPQGRLNELNNSLKLY